MAYRPPSQSRYAAITAPPPPGPFSGRRHPLPLPQPLPQPLPMPLQQEDEWITPRKRRDPVAPASTPVASSPIPVVKADEFPTLGAPSMPKKTWGSNESMAERMKKKMEEEELQRLEKETRKAEEKKESMATFIPTNIVSHQNLMRRFKEEDENAYEDEYYNGINKDGYGGEYDTFEYTASTPEYEDVDSGVGEEEWS